MPILTLMINLALALLFFPQNVLAIDCDVKTYFEAQKTNLPPDQARITLPDGTSFINPYADQNANERDIPSRIETTNSNAPLSPLKMSDMPRTPDDAKKIFDDVKASLISEIKGQSQSLSSKQTLMIERLKNLKFVVNDDCSDLASNTTAAQVVKLCFRALRLPTASLVATLGHELGHSLDLCNAGCPYHRKTNPRQALGPLIRADRKSEETQTYFRLADKYPMSTHMIQDTNSTSIDTDINTLLSNGSLVSVDQGIPLSENPLTKTYQCLESKFNYKKLPRSQNEVCEGSYFSEAGAQIWGARALANHLEKNPPQTELEKLAIFASAETSALISKGQSSKSNDFNAIYMSDPKIQKALNCTPRPHQNCMNLFDLNTSHPPPAPNSSRHAERIR